MEKYSEYIKTFQLAIIILVVSIVGAVFMVIKIVPEVQNIGQLQTDYTAQSASLADAERKLENLKQDANRKKAESMDISKMFFKPINEGLDTEAVISDEFAEILQIMRNNKIKARSVKYEYQPQDDNFVKFVPNKFHVCKVTAELVANYGSLANFMRELYKYDHFLDISSVEIVPYEKDKKVILVNLQFKLYAQKDAASLAAEEDAQKEAKAFSEAPSSDAPASIPSPEQVKQ